MEVTKATCDALSHLEDGINGFDGSISQAGFEATSQRDVQALRTFSASLAELPIVWARRVNPYALSTFIPVQNFILGQRRERSWERCWKDFGMAPPIDLRNDFSVFLPRIKKTIVPKFHKEFFGGRSRRPACGGGGTIFARGSNRLVTGFFGRRDAFSLPSVARVYLRRQVTRQLLPRPASQVIRPRRSGGSRSLRAPC